VGKELENAHSSATNTNDKCTRDDNTSENFLSLSTNDGQKTNKSLQMNECVCVCVSGTTSKELLDRYDVTS
jgi:hypothetical protein